MSRKNSILWSSLTKGISRLYAKVAGSPLGRAVSSYREPDVTDSLQKAPSAARLFWTSLLRRGNLPRLFSGIFSSLARMKVSLYGVLGLSYGVFGILLYLLFTFVTPMESLGIRYPIDYLWTFGTIGLLSVPLLFSKKRAGQALLRGRLTGLLFADLLGIPVDTSTEKQGDSPRMGWRFWPALFLGMTGVALTTYLHPFLLPACFMIFCAAGLILSLPEAGATLCVLSLPLLWAGDTFLPITLGLIVITWVSFLAKWLLMRRTWRSGPLDVIMGLLCLSLLLGGVTGIAADADGIFRSIAYALLFSVYFLIVNLFKTPNSLKGCVFGLGLTMTFSLPALYGAMLHERVTDGALSWLAGSIGGDALITGATSATAALGYLWQPAGICLLVMALPLLWCRVALSERIFGKCVMCLLTVLCFQGFFMAGAMDALLLSCLLLVVFGLLYSYKTAAASIWLLPLTVSGGALLLCFFGESFREDIASLVIRQENGLTLWQGLFKLLRDHPAGVGLSDQGFAQIFSHYLPAGTQVPALSELSLVGQLVASLGIPALLLLTLGLLFFVQKSFTCLRHSGNRRKRAVVMSSMLSCVGVFAFACFSPSTAGFPVCLGGIVLLGLSSAYENSVLAQSATLSVVEESTPYAADKVYRI